MNNDINPSDGLGNNLHQILQRTISYLFTQAELAQLTHSAFEEIAKRISNGEDEEIEIEYPVGYDPNKPPIQTRRVYKKSELVGRYTYLSHMQLPINGLLQLVTIFEITFSDIVKRITTQYPHKLDSKKKIDLKEVLSAQSIDELRMKAVDSVINELSYKSPREFAVAVEGIISVNLLECPDFHKYIELKATRDIIIHNDGIVNSTYLAKAGSHVRAAEGETIPISQHYFLESYESCLKLAEWMQMELHKVWHSSEYQERKENNTLTPNVAMEPTLDSHIDPG